MARAGVEFHPAAAAEAVAAYEWYRTRSEAAAEALYVELERAVAAIASSPHTWPEHFRGTRRYLLSKFPFALVYRIDGDALTIVAVAHGRRRPGYWHQR